MGKVVKPMTKRDLDNLEKAWANGNFRGTSNKSSSGDKRA